MLDDATLIARVVARDDHLAFAELVKRYQSKLRYSLLQMNGWNESLADDMVQETFIKAYQSLKNFKVESKFNTWLYRIAYNNLMSYYRKNAVQDNQQSLSELEPEMLPQEQLTNVDQDANSVIDLHRDVAKILQQFSLPQRLALHLNLHRGYNHEEIANVLQLPLGTVKSHINRGKKKMREHLSHWQPA